MKVSKSWSLILTMSLALQMTACSDSGSSGKSKDPSNPDSYGKVEDLTQGKVRFELEKELDFSKPEDYQLYKDFDKFGCEENGANSRKPDLSLKPGDSIVETVSIREQKISMTSLIKRTHQAATETHLTSLQKALSFQIEQAGGEVLKGQFEQQVTCSLRVDGNTTYHDCDSSPELKPEDVLNSRGLDYYRQNPDFFGTDKCKLEDSKSFGGAVHQIGTFEMADGRKVRGILQTYQSEGTIVCNKVKVGPGKEKTVSFKTNEIMPVNSFHYCGGMGIVYARTLSMGANGEKPVSSLRTEIMSGTARR